MFSLGACPRRGGIYFHVGIYFPARHALLFAMVKKNPGPSMFSPGACTRRVGIYFPGGHVLLFGIIKKKSRPQHVLTGRLPSRDRIWHVHYYYLRVATTTTTSRVRTTTVPTFNPDAPGPFTCRHRAGTKGTRTRPGPDSGPGRHDQN